MADENIIDVEFDEKENTEKKKINWGKVRKCLKIGAGAALAVGSGLIGFSIGAKKRNKNSSDDDTNASTEEF